MSHQTIDLFRDSDLRVLAPAAGLDPDEPGSLDRLRADPDALEGALAAEETFAHCFGDEPRGELLVDASPVLVFAVAVHRAADELGDTTFVAESFGGHRRIPIFDTETLHAFCADRSRRWFLVELLASFTKVTGGRAWVRRGGRWRRQRFSELDPAALVSLLDVLPEIEHPGLYRRLGDLALFLCGVFGDHTARRTLHPIELERLLRSVSRQELVGVDVERVLGRGGTAALLAWLGQCWYRAAAVRVPVHSLGRELSELADHFDSARRVLVFVTDRCLFGSREQWFGGNGG